VGQCEFGLCVESFGLSSWIQTNPVLKSFGLIHATDPTPICLLALRYERVTVRCVDLRCRDSLAYRRRVSLEAGL
jgi:hypothetical protein